MSRVHPLKKGRRILGRNRRLKIRRQKHTFFMYVLIRNHSIRVWNGKKTYGKTLEK